MRLKGNVAIMTGAASGIGQAIAVRFAQEGAAVAIGYIFGPDAVHTRRSGVSANRKERG